MTALDHLLYGIEYDCAACGASCFTKSDCDGWAPPRVVDDEGRTATFCHRCDAELEVPGALVASWRQLNSATSTLRGSPRRPGGWSLTHLTLPVADGPRP